MPKLEALVKQGGQQHARVLVAAAPPIVPIVPFSRASLNLKNIFAHVCECVYSINLKHSKVWGGGRVRGAEVLAGGLANTYRPMFSEVEKYRRDRGLTV